MFQVDLSLAVLYPSSLMSVSEYRSPKSAARAIEARGGAVLFHGDCLDLLKALPDNSVQLSVTSPPYCMGKEYEISNSVEDFISAHKVIMPEVVRLTKEGGSVCWQVGYHVKGQVVFPLDYAVFSIMQAFPDMVLRGRVIWTFGHGLHTTTRFSGRHETILWFSKGTDYYFDLDAVRVPQKYPGKRHYKGPRKGEFSGNPKGKNPGDVWEIPNVKCNHIEKLDHPCQFPVGLADRLVRALSPEQSLVLDPFMGSCSTGVAAVSNGRRFAGAEIDSKYFGLARNRLRAAAKGVVRMRPADKPIHVPSSNDAVARRPEHFVEASDD